ncbi:uncharacterized protein BKA78DRAFT_108491 [Phyllosticta capitalensis]|uniref:uncharacterized protein n=1 Tax=Phyllosticta capitalensis TaxID=121624 RepID=UPI00312D788B
MAQPLRNPRQTRSSAACDSCRSKKQKCGGEWPTCARCRETGMECTWPPQLQRGPAKGYLEAIETRLDDVEHILLQVLPLVPAEQLTSITCPGRGGGVVVEAAQKRTTQEKRAALDYWSTYPLNSPQALMVWCQDRQQRHGSRPTNEAVGAPRTASTVRETHSSGDVTASGHLTAPSPSDMNHQRSNAHASNDTTWEPSMSSRSGPPVSESPNTPGASAPLFTAQDGGCHSSSAHSDYGQVDLSDEFQQKFVW